MSYLKQARPCIQKKKENTQKKAQQVHNLPEIGFKLLFSYSLGFIEKLLFALSLNNFEKLLKVSIPVIPF
jgi:hypothetical protein